MIFYKLYPSTKKRPIQQNNLPPHHFNNVKGSNNANSNILNNNLSEPINFPSKLPIPLVHDSKSNEEQTSTAGE
jgi:hypothetical protein